MTTEMLGPKNQPVAAIEYQKTKSGWKPCSVVAGNSVYDFDWCELDGVLASHCSGFGGDIASNYQLAKFTEAPKVCAKLWYDHAKMKLTHDGKPITDKDARALGYQVISEPIDGNPFNAMDATDDETEYCEECGDRHPTERMCSHVQYEDGCGWTLGCGATEVDFGETQASLYRMLRMLSRKEIRRIRGDVLNGLCPAICVDSDYLPRRGHDLLECFAGERRYEERYWPGIAWLASLDGPCRDARALTVGWLWMFERAAWRACCIVPEYQFIRYLPMKELDKWLAIDPLEPRLLRDRPLRVPLGFKPQSANEHLFLEDPMACHEATLWPPEGTDGRVILENNLTLSVAEVRPAGRRAVDIYFGAVIERNGRHVSELAGD